MTEQAIHHDWEDRVGRAPYRFMAVIEIPSAGAFGENINGYNNALREMSEMCLAFGVHVGCCQVCGHPLANNYVCRNADGQHFIVGCDCVAKLGDTRLTTEVEEAERRRQKSAALERRKAQWVAEREAREAAERLANGGKTNYELQLERQAEAERQAAERRALVAEQNAWLIEVLKTVPTGGDFIPSMIDKLHREPLNGLSDRCVSILRDIYAKTVSGGARRNSKAYGEAEDEFYGHLEPDAE